MIKWKAIGLVGSVYAAGMLSGAAGGIYFVYSRVEKVREMPETKQEELYLGRMTRNIKMSPDQQKKMRFIVREFRQEMMMLDQVIKPRKDELTEQAITQLDDSFTDKQKDKIKRLLAQMSKRGGGGQFRKDGNRGQFRQDGSRRQNNFPRNGDRKFGPGSQDGRRKFRRPDSERSENVDAIKERMRQRRNESLEQSTTEENSVNQ